MVSATSKIRWMSARSNWVIERIWAPVKFTGESLAETAGWVAGNRPPF
jgi:hypothetical protein